MGDIEPIITRPDSWMEAAPLRISVTRGVPASPAAVWKLIVDHENWPTWFHNVKKVEVMDDADGVGGQRRVFLPGVVIEEEFTRWEPERVFAFTVTGSSRRLVNSLNERVTLAPTGDATRITYEQAFDPTRLLGVFLTVARKRMESAIDDALLRLGEQAAGAG